MARYTTKLKLDALVKMSFLSIPRSPPALALCTHHSIVGFVGQAHLDVSAFPFHRELLREHDQDPEGWETDETQARVQQQLVRELLQALPEVAVINMRWLWKSWREYVGAFKQVRDPARSCQMRAVSRCPVHARHLPCAPTRPPQPLLLWGCHYVPFRPRAPPVTRHGSLPQVGGVIEASPLELRASPSANLFIEPDGTLSLTSTHEQIFAAPFTFVGAAFPQTAVPFPALREATLAVGKACYDRGIVGHVGIDYVAFMDHDGLMRIWAVDLNIRVTHTAVTCEPARSEPATPCY